MSVKQVEVVVRVKEMPSPFPCSPVIREYSWKKFTQKVFQFFRNSLRKQNIRIFKEVCTLSNQNYVYNTGSTNQMLVVPQVNPLYIGNINLNKDQSMYMESVPKKLEDRLNNLWLLTSKNYFFNIISISTSCEFNNDAIK